jgi:hypothetical protein
VTDADATAVLTEALQSTLEPEAAVDGAARRLGVNLPPRVRQNLVGVVRTRRAGEPYEPRWS